MGAPIKINKDLLVITPNYTKKWLSEGQPKVSVLHSQVALPMLPVPSQHEPAKKTHSLISVSRRLNRAGSLPVLPVLPVPELSFCLQLRGV